MPAKGLSLKTRILSLVAFLLAVLLLLSALLPESVWRETIIGASTWTELDTKDLNYTRTLCAGWGVVIGGWLCFVHFTLLPLAALSERTRSRLRGLLLLSLVIITSFMIARTFIVFHDNVRIVGEKTPFSVWGEFLGRIWTVPVQPLTNRDYFNSLFLACAGFISLFMYIVRYNGLPSSTSSSFPRVVWGIMAFGLIWASVDELVMVHEFLGPNLPLLRSTTFTKYPDDVIMLSYFVLAAIIIIKYWKYFVARREAFLVFLLAVAFHALSAINGLPSMNLNEESFELYGGLFYFASIFWYAFGEVRESIAHIHGSDSSHHL